MNYRLKMRHHALAIVEVRSKSGKSVSGLMYNMSNEGMYVLSKDAPDIDESVEIYMPRRGKDARRAHLPGKVVHRNDKGFGIIFQKMDKQASSMLNKYRCHDQAPCSP